MFICKYGFPIQRLYSNFNSLIILIDLKSWYVNPITQKCNHLKCLPFTQNNSYMHYSLWAGILIHVQQSSYRLLRYTSAFSKTLKTVIFNQPWKMKITGKPELCTLWYKYIAITYVNIQSTKTKICFYQATQCKTFFFKYINIRSNWEI